MVLLFDGEIIVYGETRSDVSNALRYLYQVGLDVIIIYCFTELWYNYTYRKLWLAKDIQF